MKKLFYALLALPFLLVACEPEPAPEPVKEAVLTLTSDAVMTFENTGKGVITYTLENAPEGALPTATCEANWILDLEVAETITFDVVFPVPYLSENLETVIKVAYEEQSFEVTVKCLEQEVPYAMDVEMAGACRVASAEFGKADNYFFLAFADDAENIELGIVLVGAEGETILQAGEYKEETLLIEECKVIVWEPAAAYEFESGLVKVEKDGENYSFDVLLLDVAEPYHFTYEGVVLDMEPAEKPEAKTFNPVKVEAYRADSWDLGNFEVDLYIDETNYHSLDMMDLTNPNDKYLSEGNYTIANGGVTSWSNFLWNIETGEGAYVTDAEITITHYEDGTTNLKGFFESEYGDHLDIDWTGVIAGFVFGGTTPEPPTPGEGFDFTAPYFACEYFSAGSMGTPANNYWVILTDDEACNTQNPAPGATYFALDLYSDAEQDSLPLGTYTFDANDTGADGTLGFYYSFGMVISEDGTPAAMFGISGGTVTVTEGKIYAELTREDNGAAVTVTYEGDLTFGNGGGSEGSETLEGDLELNVTGAGIYAEYYADYYGVGSDNWWITVYEDDVNRSGVYLQFDILSSVSADDWRGEYISLNEATSYDYTFIPGEVSGGYLAGSWYAELNGGEISGAMAPLVYGTVEFVFNEDGSKTIVLDCVDDAGNKITGTVSSNPTASTYATKDTKSLIHVKRSMVIR